MNTEYPHPILSEAEIRKLPPEARRAFVPIPESAAKELEAKSPEERARWLAEHPADALRLERAREKRERRALARALGLAEKDPPMPELGREHANYGHGLR
jgi:hypothetical protein